MKILTEQHIMLLHKRLVEVSGGTPEIRDRGLLESALNAPFQSFGGADLYPSLLEKASRLGFGLIRNHPFADGNKRIGTHAMLVFLALNQQKMTYTDSELTDIIMGTASGTYGEKQLLEWLVQHTA